MLLGQAPWSRTDVDKVIEMQVPIQIAFENIEPSAAIEERIKSEATKLEKFYERITSARVVVARPHRRHHKGDAYCVRIHLTVPGATDIAIHRETANGPSAQQDVLVTIHDAFHAARRQLQDLAGKRHDQVKDVGARSHDEAPARGGQTESLD